MTVHEKFYEEALDPHIEKLLSPTLRIEKTNAFGLSRPRVIGDVGLRGFFQLYKKAKELIRAEKIQFLYIPIPSFYAALLGRWLHRSTGVPYGIDYIDPWVHFFPGSNKVFSRHWFSTKIASLLEPIAVKKASLITSVASSYFEGVKERNPHLVEKAVFGVMPWGGEEKDHAIVEQLNLSPYLFNTNKEKVQLVYAGAMLPMAYLPLENIFKAISQDKAAFSLLELHFIGTGKTPNDANGYNIKALAERYGLWQNIVFEYPKRIPYLDVLVHLNASKGVFILGSTEPHYTPSKVFQAILSNKPILAVLHQASAATGVIRDNQCGVVLAFDGENDVQLIEGAFLHKWQKFIHFSAGFDPTTLRNSIAHLYSAKKVTHELVNCLNEALGKA